MECNPCEGTGFYNPEQIPGEVLEAALQWIKENPDTDACVCGCCGDGDSWYGEPGRHYTSDDPVGMNGPYANNGGLCRCH